MRTLASVDLPDPLGPMMAWISPGRILRSTPRRISLPSTVAWRSSISRIGSVIDAHTPSALRGGGGAAHVDIAAFDLGLVGGHGPGGRQPAHRPRPHGEPRPVLGALHLFALEPPLVQLDVLVAADVVDGEELTVHVAQAHRLIVDLDAGDLARLQVPRPGNPYPVPHQASPCFGGTAASGARSLEPKRAATPPEPPCLRAMASWRAERTSSMRTRLMTSSKNPSTISRCASSRETPRDCR